MEFKAADRVRCIDSGHAMHGRLGTVLLTARAHLLVNVMFDGPETQGARHWYVEPSSIDRIPSEPKAGAPSPLPETLPVGTRFTHGNGSLCKALTDVTLDDGKYWAKWDNDVPFKSTYVYPDRIDWPSYHRALSSSQAGGTGEATVPDTCAPRTIHVPQSSATEVPLCPRCGNGTVDPASERCTYCGTSRRQLELLRSEQTLPACLTCGRPTPANERESGYGNCVECYGVPGSNKPIVALDRRIATARADLDRGQHPRSWPIDAWMDAPDGEL